MLSFRPMAAGSLEAAASRAAYLSERDLTPDRAALSDYYLEGKPLSDPVYNGARLRADLHPRVAAAIGVRAGQSLSDKQLTFLLAGRRADGGVLPGADRQISGYDLTFQADKSVSVAWALAPTESERAMIVQAHRDAVESAARYVAGAVGHARYGAHSTESERGDVGWVAFDHYAARKTLEIAATDSVTGEAYTHLHTLKSGVGDPHLHTHLILFNLVAAENRVGALDTMALKGRIHEFGAVYQAYLATNLRRIGARVEMDRETGSSRLTSVPKSLCRHFSKRTSEAHEAAQEWAKEQGVDWDALSPEGRIALVHREAGIRRLGKGDDRDQTEAWQAQAVALKWTQKSIVDEGLRLDPAAMSAQIRTRGAYEASMPLVSDTFKREAVVSGYKLREIAARGLIETGITGPGDIDRVTAAYRDHGVMQDGRKTDLLWGEDRGHRNFVRVTTQLHKEQEEEFVTLAARAAADRSGTVSADVVQVAVDRSGLNFSGEHGEAQRRQVDRFTQGARLEVFEGTAGAGKTALLAPVVDARKTAGWQVYGTAPGWKQATELLKAGVTKGDEMALERFINRAERGELDLGPKTQVIVDELGQAGMARHMLKLLRMQKEHGFSIACLAGINQCTSIDAGPVVELMRRALGDDAIPKIWTTIRQDAERERENAALLRDGKAAQALENKQGDGTLHIVPGGRREAIDRAVEMWAERMAAHKADSGYSLTVSAPTNADAQAIALAIRDKRRGAGEIGRDLVTKDATDGDGKAHYRIAVAAGDRVRIYERLFGRGEDGLPVHIGNNADVVRVAGADKKTISFRTESGKVVAVPWGKLTDRSTGRVKLAYGDVLTVDSVQGATSTDHIAVMPDGSRAVNGFRATVTGSRHRRRTDLITSDGAERREITQRRPLGDTRPITEKDVLANMARNLSRQPVKDSALAFLERAVEIRRQAARGLQQSAQRMESRAARGRQPSMVRHVLQRQRDELAVAHAMAQVNSLLREQSERLAKLHTPPMLEVIDPRAAAEARFERRVRSAARMVERGDVALSDAMDRLVSSEVAEQKRGAEFNPVHGTYKLRPGAETIEGIEARVDKRLMDALDALMDRGEDGLREATARKVGATEAKFTAARQVALAAKLPEAHSNRNRGVER